MHPLTGEKIPLRYADYVLPDYATGCVMMVPAHDERDWDFAQKFSLPYLSVIDGPIVDGKSVVVDGVLINS